MPTIAAIEAAGAVPVLADVDPETYTIDPARIEEALTERTRAIVPVHLYGQCADMPAIVELAARRDLKVVEDAAQAHGAADRGRRAGALGDAAAFSFYPTKNLGALGDGGAVVTSDPSVARQARLLRSYGESERYLSVRSGRNSRLDTMQAALLRAKLAQLERWTERRREIAAAYTESFAGLPIDLPVEADGRRHVYHLFVVATQDRDGFREALRDDGVETLVHYPRPVHGHPAYRQLAPSGRRLDESERLARQVVSLPLFPELTQREVETVIAAVRRACASA